MRVARGDEGGAAVVGGVTTRGNRVRRVAHRLLFWSLVVAFVAVALLWLAYFPFRPERLYRAVPPAAEIVSLHRDLGGRWPSMVRHPLVAAYLRAGGVTNRKVTASLSSRSTCRWMLRLAARETVCAYLPPGNGTAFEGVMVASWVGRYGQYLRWGLVDLSDEGLIRVKREDGIPLWHWVDDNLPEGLSASLSVFEGVAVACLSPDPDAAVAFHHRLALDAPPAALLQLESGSTVPDTVWLARKDLWHGQPVRIAVGPLEAARLTAAVDLPPTEGLGRQTEGHAMARLWPFLDNAPDILLAAPMQLVDASAEGWGVPDGARHAISRIAREAAPEGAVVGCVASGEYGSRVLGLKVPTLIVAVEMRESAGSSGLVSNVLDVLNAEMGWSLIPCQGEPSDTWVQSIGSGRRNVLMMLGGDDLPAVTSWENWLVFCSSRRVLVTMLNRARGGGVESAMAEWARGGSTESLSAYAWLDGRRAADSFRAAKAVYELSQILGNRREKDPVRSILAKIDTALELLHPLESAEALLRGPAQQPHATLRLTALTRPEGVEAGDD